MSNRRRTSATNDRADRLAAYQRILGALARHGAEAPEIPRLLQQVTGLVAGATHIRHVKVMRYRADQADLLVEAGVGWKEGVVGTVAFPVDMASPPDRALQTAMPVVIEDLPREDEFVAHPTLVEHGIVSLMNVPVMVDGATWGVLEVDADQPRHFDDADIGFLGATANILGMAIQHRQHLARHEQLNQARSAATGRAEALLEELQHRVRNNFQTILSFLSLQRRHAKDEDAKIRFSDVTDRVLAIALAHDQLSHGMGTGSVEFGDYLRALCKNIDPRRRNVVVEVEAKDLNLPLDRAVPAGLIVNELVTNAYKHAFDDGGGRIRVVFEVHPEVGEALIVVEDVGKGAGPPREGGMGLKLIETFAMQLNGHVEREDAEPGTRTRVWFPLPM